MRFESSEYFALASDAQGEQFIRSGDEVVVVALQAEDGADDAEGTVLLAVEPAPARGRRVVVLPGGTVGEGEAPALAANRELQEEIGYAAGRLDYLGELWPWAKYLSVRSFVYLARDLMPSKLPDDEPYEIGVERVRLADLTRLATHPDLRDARVLAALLMAHAFLEEAGR